MLRRFAALLLLVSCLTLQAQTVEQTLKFAQSSLNAGNYEIARDAFERVLFFDQNSIFDNASYVGLATSYYKTGRFPEAARAYRLAANTSSGADNINSLFLSSISEIRGEDYKSALNVLLSLPTLDDSLEAKKNFYLGVSYFLYDDLERSEHYFIKAVKPLGREKDIHEIFTGLKSRLKDPRKAKLLSIIFPGMGQLYNGDYKNAANSFILNAGLLALFYFTAVNFTVLDAYLVVFPWFQRYYFGGIKKAALITEASNRKKKDRSYQQLLDIFEKQ